MVFATNCFSSKYPLRVYRQLEAKYVDQFFEDGSLLFKTFEDFAKNPDEARCDKEEGYGTLNINYQQYKTTIQMRVGFNHLVLCTSLLDSGNALCDSYNACFAITDIPSFCQEVTKVLSSKYQVNSYYCAGPCIYKDHRILDVEGTMFDIMCIPPSPRLSMNLSFLKKTCYSTQYEYRLMFCIDDPAELKSQILKVPDARQFCIRIR